MKREKLLLIGGGGHSKVVISILYKLDKFDILGIIDKYKSKGTTINGIKVIGEDKDLEDFYNSGVRNALITLGSVKDNIKRENLFNITKDIGYDFPVIVSPDAIIDKNVEIGEGTVIMPGVIINPDAKIGKNCIINTGAIVEHDCILSDHIHIAPGVHISGGVNIGKGSFVGIGATIIQGINIGRNVTIGAGTVVIRDVPDNVVLVGNPARVVKEK